jgi:lipoprotein-anchoring transpeptidase ErfK/SrfK
MRRFWILTALLPALAVPAAPAAAADPPAVPAGVTAGGVDLSGLPLDQAAAKLQADLAPRFARPMVLGLAGRVFKLQPAEATFAFDALTSAKRALRAKKPGPVPLKLTFSKRAIRSWLETEVRKPLARAPRDASVTIGLRHQTLRKARHGRTVGILATEALISKQLADETAPRYVRTRLSKVTPEVTTTDIRRRYATIVTVDQANFRLRLFKGLKLSKSYGVAVGQPAYPTPRGLFSIANKQVNPTWSVPNSPWAGELQGTTVQGGSAANPLKARWMGIVNGVGIHGTGEEGSIGSRASHGCIRMRVADVIDLYPRVPVGAPVLIR